MSCNSFYSTSHTESFESTDEIRSAHPPHHILLRHTQRVQRALIRRFDQSNARLDMFDVRPPAS